MSINSWEHCARPWMSVVRIVESGGGCASDSIARARSPAWERSGQRRTSVVMTEVQKRVGSLSDASRESQATEWGDCLAHWLNRVVLPLPAEAHTNPTWCSRTVSRARCNRSRFTRMEGRRGEVALVTKSGADAECEGAGE